MTLLFHPHTPIPTLRPGAPGYRHGAWGWTVPDAVLWDRGGLVALSGLDGVALVLMQSGKPVIEGVTRLGVVVGMPAWQILDALGDGPTDALRRLVAHVGVVETV